MVPSLGLGGFQLNPAPGRPSTQYRELLQVSVWTPDLGEDTWAWGQSAAGARRQATQVRAMTASASVTGSSV